MKEGHDGKKREIQKWTVLENSIRSVLSFLYLISELSLKIQEWPYQKMCKHYMVNGQDAQTCCHTVQKKIQERMRVNVAKD